MKINGEIRKYSLLAAAGGSILAIVAFSFAIIFFNPLGIPSIIDWDEPPVISETTATYEIKNSVHTNFGHYSPQTLSYEPQITPIQIQSNLGNVDMQGLSLPAEVVNQLEQYGFALVDEGYEDIYEIYEERRNPKFITTDLCLHAYHVLYDLSLRILEGTHFSTDFETLLNTLRSQQIALKGTVTEVVVQDALTKNIAYLSVMLYLLDNTTTTPSDVENLVNLELANIDAGERAESVIFGYEEDYSQYKVRGHYTRTELLSRYFKAMIYAGRMGFLLQSPSGGVEMGINHTRMAMSLLSSFNATIEGTETGWDYWDRIYQPTAFYVGASDDLTAIEYYQIWKEFNFPQGDQLANNTLILEIIDEAKTYRKPQINSMFVYEVYEHENVTQGLRLMGQRFIPDSYIFQQLIHTAVGYRFLPKGLDVFSVFGSSRAAEHLQDENATYIDYSSQILKLRQEFANLTDYDWTQNLYWLWLYSLFPLLKPASNGYPGFMRSDAWTDKALMTTMGSWAELRHDTILYAKQPYAYELSMIKIREGYVEPYPELYARLASLANLMENGLEARGLVIEGFNDKLSQITEVFERLVEISIKELENEALLQSDIDYINYAGTLVATIASYNDPDVDEWTSEADDRMAIIADVVTDPNTRQVLEVGTGNPFVIYVVVQDHQGNLRMTRGGTFSYYEFHQPMSNRLSDEEWHVRLDTNPPPLPEWLSSLPITTLENTVIMMVIKED